MKVLMVNGSAKAAGCTFTAAAPPAASVSRLFARSIVYNF